MGLCYLWDALASGKSTVMAALLQRGYAMLADDVTGIALADNGQPQVLPAFPCARLWADVVTKLGYDGLARQRIRAELEKYLLPVDHFYLDRDCQCARCMFSQPTIKEHIQLEAVETAHRFQWLYDYTYRKRFLLGLQLLPVHF